MGRRKSKAALALLALAAGCAAALWRAPELAERGKPAAMGERERQARERRAWGAGALRASLQARRDCSVPFEQLPKGGQTPAQARAAVECQLAWGAKAVDGAIEAELRQTLSRLDLGSDEDMASARRGYEQGGPYASSVSALLTFNSILGWQMAALAAGEPGPEEAARRAREGLALFKATLRRELAAAQREDEGLWAWDGRRALPGARAWGEGALAAYWRLGRPEAAREAMEAYMKMPEAEREGSEHERLEQSAKAWAREEREALEREIWPEGPRRGLFGG